MASKHEKIQIHPLFLVTSLEHILAILPQQPISSLYPTCTQPTLVYPYWRSVHLTVTLQLYNKTRQLDFFALYLHPSTLDSLSNFCSTNNYYNIYGSAVSISVDYQNLLTFWSNLKMSIKILRMIRKARMS